MTDPEKVPLPVGAYEIETCFFPPGVIVDGNTRPLTLNPVPVKFAAETVTEVVPVLLNVTDRLELLPINTLPNARLVGEALSRAVAVDVDVPDNVTVGAAVDELLAILIEPENVPVVVGVNRIPRFTDCPAATVIGNTAPKTVNAAPVTLAPVTEIDEPLVFEIVKLCVDVVFTTTLPKFTADGDTEIVAGSGVGFVLPVTPVPHPVLTRTVIAARKIGRRLK